MQLIAPVKSVPVKSVYLIHGGEIWQTNDAIDQIYINYRNNNLKKYYFTNFTEFEKFIAEQKKLVYHLDLFCEQAINTLIKLDINEAKFTKKQQEILLKLLSNLNNIIIIFIATKLSRAAISSAWFAAISKIGVIIVAKNLSIAKMQWWVKEQLAQENLHITEDALDFFIKQHQNNLLAGSQNIYKLSLTNNNINLALLKKFVLNHAEHSVFDFLDALINKNIEQIIYMLYKLKEQQVENTLILWAINRFIKQQQYYELLPKAAEIDLAIKNTNNNKDNKLYIWSLFLDLCLNI